jgi:hypothetical protein
MYFDDIKVSYKDLFSLLFMFPYIEKDIDMSVKYQTSGNYPQAIHDER